MADHTVTLKLTVSDQALRDLLVTAVEGGANYWAEFTRVKRDADLNILSVVVRDQETLGCDWLVTPHTLVLGLQRLADATWKRAHDHLHAAVVEDGDAETADVVLQMALFGELVYG